MSERLSLIVDDESAVRALIKSILKRDGFESVEAKDGDEALQLLQKLGDAIDLLVSDVQMPKCDGIALVRAVRAAFPRMPIVLISGYAEIDPATLSDGVLGFVQKPFRPDELLSKVRQILRSAESSNGG